MSKQNINIGQVIDDGTGDYSRKAGIKMNSNADEIYHNFGDDTNLHPSGAWKVITPTGSSDNTIQLKFGQQLIINASQTMVNVYLPKAVVTDIGKTVKLRDTYKTWGSTPNSNLVSIHSFVNTTTGKPQSNNLIKGINSTVNFNDAYRDLEFTYSNLGWEYVDSKYIDRISNANRSIENSIEFSAQAIDSLQQWDLNKSYSYVYEPKTIEVFRKGNLLTRGTSNLKGIPTITSDYGSIPTITNPSVIIDVKGDGTEMVDLGIAPLDGKTIKLKVPGNENDTIIVKSLLENPDVYTSTYKSKSVIIQDINETNNSLFDNQSVVKYDTKNKSTISLIEMGMAPNSFFNPGSLNVLINGKQLINEQFIDWTENQISHLTSWDFSVEKSHVDLNNDGDIGDPNTGSPDDDSAELINSLYNTIVFANKGYLQNGDVLTIEWFNNNTGATLDWEGKGGIEELVSDQFVKSTEIIAIKNNLTYSDIENPNTTTAVMDNSLINIRIANINNMFDLFNPVGTIYENAHNPNNPATYMGFGEWRPYAKDHATVGWGNTGVFAVDPITQTPVAGGVFGGFGAELKSENIPPVKSEEFALQPSSANDSTVQFNDGCLLDPTSQSDVEYYKSEKININKQNINPTQVSTIQPSVTVYRWIRVA